MRELIDWIDDHPRLSGAVTVLAAIALVAMIFLPLVYWLWIE